jgi:hypothetical protein
MQSVTVYRTDSIDMSYRLAQKQKTQIFSHEILFRFFLTEILITARVVSIIY